MEKDSGKSVLVTGASGFLGGHLCRELHEKGYKVHALVRRTSNLSRLKDIPIDFHFGNLWENNVLEEAVVGKEYIFHLAGVIAARSRDGYFSVNRDDTKNLISTVLARNPGIKRFVHVSSQAAGSASNGKEPVNEQKEPKPLTYYGLSKLAGEREVLKHKGKMPVSVIRPPAIYGPSDRPTLNFFRFAKYGIVPVFGREETFISIAHVKDVVKSLILAAEKDEALGEIFYVSDGEIYPWIELWRTMCRAAGKKGRVVRIPMKLFFALSFIAETFGKIIGKPMMLNYHKATDLTKSWALDISKIRSRLGFVPTYKLDRGARETYNWYKKEGWL